MTRFQRAGAGALSHEEAVQKVLTSPWPDREVKALKRAVEALTRFLTPEQVACFLTQVQVDGESWDVVEEEGNDVP